WLDTSRNGQQDAGEPGIPGVTVRLLDITGTTVRQHTTTLRDWISDVCAADLTYVVQFVTPAGAYDTFTTANVGSDVTDSDANTRSEERRVGKECRARRKTNDYKKKMPIDMELSKSVDNATPLVGSNDTFNHSV